MTENRSHLTAVYRSGPSVPTRWLVETRRIGPRDRVFDYGCGRGVDVLYFEHLGCPHVGEFDPYYSPTVFWEGEYREYDVVICHYVLNVLDKERDREHVLSEIKKLLRPGGQAFVTVRCDRKNCQGWTPRGTYQTYITLGPPWSEIRKTSFYRIYEFQKEM